MHSFKDNNGREWRITLHVPAIKRVRELLSFDLLAILEKKSDVLERLASDPVLLVDVLYVLVKDQADESKIDDLKFGTSLGGDAIDQAATALLDELVFFFRPPQRAALAKLLAKIKSLEQKAAAAAIERIDGDAADKVLAKRFREVDAELERLAAPSPTSGS